MMPKFYKIEWRGIAVKPSTNCTVLVHTLDDEYFVDHIENDWEGWSERVIRWAYL